MATVPAEQAGQKLLMDGQFAALQHGNLGRIVVYGNNFMADLRKTRGRNKSNITRTDNRYAHVSLFLTRGVCCFEINRYHSFALWAHAAPEPLRTAGIVMARILRSSHKDHSSRYCMSILIH